MKLGELVPDPARFSFSWPGPAEVRRIGESLARFGQLRPLLCMEEGGALHLVAGHRRVRLLEELGTLEAAVRRVHARSREELWDLLLEDHLDARPLNPVELGLYARRRAAETGESREELARKVLPRLGLPPKASRLEDPLWLSGLPHEDRDAFAEGRLPAQGARVLARADRDDALAILRLLRGASVGVNKFSELARWILECAWAEGEPAENWLAARGVGGAGQSVEALRAEVRRRRYPQLSAWESAFARDVGALSLPSGVRIAPPQGFEGGTLTCSVTFASADELGRALRALLERLEAGELAVLDRYLS
ncbi:MAG: hypothetical protein Kow0092_05600 [Deferrisomatales bacterium]